MLSVPRDKKNQNIEKIFLKIYIFMCILENTVSKTVSYTERIIASFFQDFKNAKREENMAEIQVLISLKPVQEEFMK